MADFGSIPFRSIKDTIILYNSGLGQINQSTVKLIYIKK